jgi:uncharacterized membrane protein YqjE
MIFGAARPRRPRSASRPRRAEASAPEGLPPKLIPAVRSMISAAVSLAHTRLALAGIELEEELQRFIGVAVLGVVALVFALMTLIVGTFTIVAAVPPEHRIVTMVGITVIYLAIAVIALVRIRSIFSSRPPIFAGTLAELEKDKETLSQMNRAHEAAEYARERAETVEDAFAPVRRADSAERGI